jgi:hypothetical protein
MRSIQWLALATSLTLLATPAVAGTAVATKAPRTSNLDGGVVVPTPPPATPEGPAPTWTENFDSYATGMQLHGVNGWKGWNDDAAAGALTSATQALSAPNSVDILGASDLIREFTGYDSGTWTFTAHQFIPSGTTGQPYFILLNNYVDLGPTNNWSTQICFDVAAGLVRDDVPGDCTGTPTLPIVLDQWVELKVVIDLDLDSQTFSYGGQELYTDTWTGHVSGGGILNIDTVDLFANTSSSVFYDDMSLSSALFEDGFESGDTSAWDTTAQ